MLYVQRKAEAVNAPTEGLNNIINLSSCLMEKYWRPFHAAATIRIWAALYRLGSSFTDAHEDIGGTWDPRCQHDSSQPAQCGFQRQCRVVKWVLLCQSCRGNPTDHTDHTCSLPTQHICSLDSLQMFTSFEPPLHPHGVYESLDRPVWSWLWAGLDSMFPS